MNFFSKKEDLEKIKKQSLKRCEEIIYDTDKNRKIYKKDSIYWNSVHLWIGGLTAILAAMSSAFSFLDISIKIDENTSLPLSGIVSFLAAISASILTFINPSNRSAKAQKIAVKYEILYHKALESKTLIDCSNDQEYIIETLKNLMTENKKLIEERQLIGTF